MTQSRSLAETASDACDRGSAAESLMRARQQAGAFEFHCGNPPPAAEPRTMILNPPRPAGHASEALSDLGAGVGVDFEPDRDLDDPRLYPFFHADLPTSPPSRSNLGTDRLPVNAHRARDAPGLDWREPQRSQSKLIADMNSRPELKFSLLFLDIHVLPGTGRAVLCSRTVERRLNRLPR